MSTQAEREAEVDALIARALDPDDPYTASHHEGEQSGPDDGDASEVD